MLTEQQINDLARQFQIDRFTVFREYLQLLFLNEFYQQSQTGKTYFKGGTALRLLFNSPRFSEDLDFSASLSQKQIIKLVKQTQTGLKRRLANFKIKIQYPGKNSIRFRCHYQAEDFKYPFNIRLDFNQEANLKPAQAASLITDFPMTIFPLIVHLSAEEILAEKIRALVNRAKGRDVYDIWFLLEKGIKPDWKLVEAKQKLIKKKFNYPDLIKKIKRFSQKKLKQDLDKFLPQGQRKLVADLKPRLLAKLDLL